MEKTIFKPAVKIEQRDQVIYASSFTIGDFMRPNFYTVETLDETRDSKYQRYLDKRRARKFSKEFVDSWKKEELFLPTSLFLATSKELVFADGQIELGASAYPFYVVDGQHRISALVEAAKEAPEMKSFPVMVTIAPSLGNVHQMVHFYIINTQQKSVDKGLEKEIIARLTKMRGFEDAPLPSAQLRRQVDKLAVMKAVDLVDYLSQELPWRGRIAKKNAPPKKGEVKRAAMANTLEAFVFTPNHPITSYSTEEAQKIMANYWCAIEAALVPKGKGNDTVVFKDNGLWFFHYVSGVIISWLTERRDFKVKTIKSKLETAFECLDSDAEKIADEEWWLVSRNDGDKKSAGKEDRAGKENRSSLLDLAKRFQEAVTEARKKEKAGGIQL